ncbi:phytoene desaturase family protein [Gordonia shandongensis]|uniref:phytoene desaturase family protein n=1 Tax=Gordonia shandongensis TaxID=376351 RepID=UPI00040543B3|nr:NAD(P)/FAD-dependent oxidoreductase [Gordonia shandongensis]
MNDEADAVVVGAGPNGLTAAAVLARAGLAVLVLEASSSIGGGCRTDEAFGAGIRRDVCAAVHPTGYASPAFADLGLHDRVDWLVPEISVAHAFGPGDAIGVHRDAVRSPAVPGRDARAWRNRVAAHRDLVDDVLAMPGLPTRPAAMARFGASAAAPVDAFVRAAFRDERTRTAFAGIAAHGARPLRAPGSTAPGLLLGALADSGWPIAAGGSQAIVDGLAAIVTEHGGRIETGREVTSMADLPAAPAVLFDVSARSLARIVGDALPRRYARRLDGVRHGPGVCKVDFVLSEPIPWADGSAPTRTATFHIAEDRAQIGRSELLADTGRIPDRPWVLGGEPTRLDPTRAPRGRHLAWAYCHVPLGCDTDVSDRIVAEIDRCAPGFTDTVIDRITVTAAELEAYNANFVGGDISGGTASLRQLLARPTLTSPHTTGVPGVYLCSSAAAPGGGVHGMSGYRAARAALRDLHRA